MLAAGMVEQAEPNELDGEAMSRQIYVLRHVQGIIKNRLESLETQALETIKKGGYIPGWGKDTGAGRRSWDRSDAEVLELGKVFGVNVTKPCTPRQAEIAGVPSDVVNAYSSASRTGVKLIEAERSITNKVFGGE
jgi:hypothetical protein